MTIDASIHSDFISSRVATRASIAMVSFVLEDVAICDICSD